jgi:hypothetical protein
VLSQLSYSPFEQVEENSNVGLGGLEPPTLRLSGVRSNHLSYRPSNEDGGLIRTVRHSTKIFKEQTLAPFKTRQQTHSFCENVDLVTCEPKS